MGGNALFVISMHNPPVKLRAGEYASRHSTRQRKKRDLKEPSASAGSVQ
jgi:hypothetical protein